MERIFTLEKHLRSLDVSLQAYSLSLKMYFWK